MGIAHISCYWWRAKATPGGDFRAQALCFAPSRTFECGCILLLQAESGQMGGWALLFVSRQELRDFLDAEVFGVLLFPKMS